MSLKTHGSHLKAFLADPHAWPDYGGYERVVISINEDCPTLEWDAGDIADGDRVEVIEGYRLDGAGRRMGCFVASISAWMLTRQNNQILIELPEHACPLLEAWVQNIGARVVEPQPA